MKLKDFCSEQGLPYKDSGVPYPGGNVLCIWRSVSESVRVDAGRDP
jgi:hypothetical protein